LFLYLHFLSCIWNFTVDQNGRKVIGEFTQKIREKVKTFGEHEGWTRKTETDGSDWHEWN
jgi:hypothetical protein